MRSFLLIIIEGIYIKKYLVYLRTECDNVNYVKSIDDASILRRDVTKKYANIEVNNGVGYDDEIVQSKIVMHKNEIRAFLSGARPEFS